MAIEAQRVMQLTNGTTTIDIQNWDCSTAGYHLQGHSYTPRINRRNKSGFGDVFLPVEETLSITVVGSTSDDVHDKLAALVVLMDSVQLWADTDAADADAVTFVYKPTLSNDIVFRRALVTGGARVDYSQYIERVGAWVKMPDVRISFSRGVWLGDDQTATSSTVTQPAVQVVTFGTPADVTSPVNVKTNITTLTGIFTETDSLTVVSEDEIYFVEAESMTFGALNAGVTAVTKASGGSVLYGTPLGTGIPNPYAGKTFNHVTEPLMCNNFFVVGTIRNKSSTINWSVETSVYGAGTLSQTVKTQIVAGQSTPMIFNLGSFYFDDLHGDEWDVSIVFELVNDAGGTSADQIEFDCFAIVPISRDTTGQFSTRDQENTVYGSDGRVLTNTSGFVYSNVISPSIDSSVVYSGNARLNTSGLTLYSIHFWVLGTADGWRHYGAGTGSTGYVTATRRLASLTPK